MLSSAREAVYAADYFARKIWRVSRKPNGELARLLTR
jgi:hypothetical protein